MIDFIDLPADFDKIFIAKWLNTCAIELGANVKRLTYHIVNDEKILEVNRSFLKHDYYTDIITFDYGTKKRLTGDIYVSIDTVKSNAMVQNVRMQEEFMRVLAHGMLHLAGYEDQDVEKQKVMSKAEDFCLSLRFKI